MSEHVKEFTDDNFDAEVLKNDKPVLVDFWAPWCMPCKALAPTIEELATEYEGKVVIGKLNSDEHPKMASTWDVRGLPTVMVFQGGKVVESVFGLNSKAKYVSVIDGLLSSSVSDTP